MSFLLTGWLIIMLGAWFGLCFGGLTILLLVLTARGRRCEKGD